MSAADLTDAELSEVEKKYYQPVHTHTEIHAAMVMRSMQEFSNTHQRVSGRCIFLTTTVVLRDFSKGQQRLKKRKKGMFEKISHQGQTRDS